MDANATKGAYVDSSAYAFAYAYARGTWDWDLAKSGTFADGATVAPVLLSLELTDIVAQIGGKAYNFEVAVDYASDSVHQDGVLVQGQIGGDRNRISFPMIQSSDPLLAALLEISFLQAFLPDAQGNIAVTEFVLGQGVTPAGEEGLVFNTTLGEAFTVDTDESKLVGSIPEPSALALFGIGGLCLLIYHMRERKARGMRG